MSGNIIPNCIGCYQVICNMRTHINTHRADNLYFHVCLIINTETKRINHMCICAYSIQNLWSHLRIRGQSIWLRNNAQTQTGNTQMTPETRNPRTTLWLMHYDWFGYFALIWPHVHAWALQTAIVNIFIFTSNASWAFII